MLYSMGKDSAVMLHLARKAFFPGPLPFPLLHVDTTWKFRDMYAMRDKVAAEPGVELIVYRNPEALEKGINPFDHGPLHTDMWKTRRAAAGARQARLRRRVRRRPPRRGEEPARRSGCSASATRTTAGIPSGSGRSSGRSTMCARTRGESMRVFPLSNWTELDVWQYILREGIEVVPLYFAAERPTVEREGLILMVDDERMRLEPRRGGGKPQGPVPNARLLSALGRSRKRSDDGRGHHRRDAARARHRSARAGSSTGTAAARRWRRRSRRAIFDGAGGDREPATSAPGSPRRSRRSCCASSPAAASTTASRR